MLVSNESDNDRVMRVLLGLLFISFVFLGPRTPWGWLGLALVGTGLMGWCPLYTLFGVNTRTSQPK